MALRSGACCCAHSQRARPRPCGQSTVESVLKTNSRISSRPGPSTNTLSSSFPSSTAISWHGSEVDEGFAEPTGYVTRLPRTEQLQKLRGSEIESFGVLLPRITPLMSPTSISDRGALYMKLTTWQSSTSVQSTEGVAPRTPRSNLDGHVHGWPGFAQGCQRRRRVESPHSLVWACEREEREERREIARNGWSGNNRKHSRRKRICF